VFERPAGVYFLGAGECLGAFAALRRSLAKGRADERAESGSFVRAMSEGEVPRPHMQQKSSSVPSASGVDVLQLRLESSDVGLSP
jgi:hypothetical protein